MPYRISASVIELVRSMKDDHALESAARAGSARSGSSTSTPPSVPNRSSSAVNNPAGSAGSLTASVRIARASASISQSDKDIEDWAALRRRRLPFQA
jgi:hypothetical protein